MLDTKNITAASFHEDNPRIHTATTDLLLQDSVASVGSFRQREKVQGYTYPKLPEQDARKNINILNWKIYNIPARGKQTYLDEIIKYQKKKNHPDCKYDQADWIKEVNSKAKNGIT